MVRRPNTCAWPLQRLSSICHVIVSDTVDSLGSLITNSINKKATSMAGLAQRVFLGHMLVPVERSLPVRMVASKPRGNATVVLERL